MTKWKIKNLEDSALPRFVDFEKEMTREYAGMNVTACEDGKVVRSYPTRDFGLRAWLANCWVQVDFWAHEFVIDSMQRLWLSNPCFASPVHLATLHLCFQQAASAAVLWQAHHVLRKTVSPGLGQRAANVGPRIYVWETSWTAFFCTHKQQTEKQKARTESNKKTNSPMVQESGLTSLTVIYSRLSVPTFRAHMWAHTVSHPQKGMLTSGLVKMIRPWNKRHCYTGRKDGNFSVISGFQKILKVKILFSIYMCVYHVFL